MKIEISAHKERIAEPAVHVAEADRSEPVWFWSAWIVGTYVSDAGTGPNEAEATTRAAESVPALLREYEAITKPALPGRSMYQRMDGQSR